MGCERFSRRFIWQNDSSMSLRSVFELSKHLVEYCDADNFANIKYSQVGGKNQLKLKCLDLDCYFVKDIPHKPHQVHNKRNNHKFFIYLK